MNDTPAGDRIAKVIARSGRASRRDAEKLIAEGRVSVNGKRIDTPALNVGPNARITVDGEPLAAAEPVRLWRYHKTADVVTTARDEKGRATVFDKLPEGMPRVMTVGRLDLTSEGLLLLTNDGELKRKLELPSTGWVRKYRARIKGTPDQAMVDTLARGIVVDGQKYLPMQVTIDRQQGANAWLTIGLREGKNREIRNALSQLGYTVNRLIRVSYGPFQLGDLKPGEVAEVRARTMREQLGNLLPDLPAEPVAGKPARPPRQRADRNQPASRPHKPGQTNKPGKPRGPKPEKPNPAADASRSLRRKPAKPGGPRKPRG